MCELSFIYSYVVVFDPKTGQENKEVQVKGKIQKLIDWPNGAGIRRSNVYNLYLGHAFQ